MMDQQPSLSLAGLLSVTRARGYRLYTSSGKRYWIAPGGGQGDYWAPAGSLSLALKDARVRGSLLIIRLSMGKDCSKP